MTRHVESAIEPPLLETAERPGAAAIAPLGLAPEGISGLEPLLEAKLWRNPCWFSFRLNYTAMHFNGPIYVWIRRVYGLSRPEYAVIYALGIGGSRQASEITRASGHPKNTLSRAIAKLEEDGLIARDTSAASGRNQILSLTRRGQDLFDTTLPTIVEHERKLLAGISEEERATLSRILAKVVLGSRDWPTVVGGIPGNPEDDPPDEL
ncbi:MarR family winged helix-turn-helix transcriptional regulator [Rhizobium binxianense]